MDRTSCTCFMRDLLSLGFLVVERLFRAGSFLRGIRKFIIITEIFFCPTIVVVGSRRRGERRCYVVLEEGVNDGRLFVEFSNRVAE